MGSLPPLPPIEGELLLEVYTHESLNVKPGAITNDKCGGSARLVALGEKILEAAVTSNVFRRQPMHTALRLNEITKDYVSKTSVDRWATDYNLRSKVRCAPGLLAKLKSPEEGRLLFVAYVGALYVQSGYNVVQDWINQLLEPSEKRVRNEPPTFSVPSPLPQQMAAPPNVAATSQARLYNQFSKPDTPTFSQPSPRASHPPPYMSGAAGPFSSDNGFSQPGSSRQPQPPPPTTRPPPLPPTPGQQISYLPLFNQTASQRRLGVEYTAQFFGPPHAGKWHVKCLVNNIEKGQGNGPSKQLAKEEAAKQAFYAMGWST